MCLELGRAECTHASAKCVTYYMYDEETKSFFALSFFSVVSKTFFLLMYVFGLSIN